MRELNLSEIKEVNGGVVPLIGVAVAIAGHAAARTLGAWVISRVGTIVAVYSAAEAYGPKPTKKDD
ncbi:class IIb bacteriocin, lactobin A/cerein 7B family [uncultured Paraglaciecola sp.]|uniref:class IIb bacteriocin, lactobin A/cerein 7B family n=1 Tax=uncultured Paraglaciecola sp. TaxID=1765024 RepID=UPI0025FCF9C9|nr:class IIb bacteriocin, lactobin A/cerein 7B family [uncultured Paraglaciecola sp.]